MIHDVFVIQPINTGQEINYFKHTRIVEYDESRIGSVVIRAWYQVFSIPGGCAFDYLWPSPHEIKVVTCQYVILAARSEEHTSELQSRPHLVCRLLLEK